MSGITCFRDTKHHGYYDGYYLNREKIRSQNFDGRNFSCFDGRKFRKGVKIAHAFDEEQHIMKSMIKSGRIITDPYLAELYK